MFDKDKLQEAIKKAGMTAKEFAAYIGIDESTLYRKINDNGRFNREEISKAADLIGPENTIAIFFA